ncbi:MAG TPA: hypothetical protein PLP89_03775 [Synergistales bacterium]|nr:hypothetical protein [Synergistales bacterium]HRV71119.1 hypothetical protein [Thermovirgaceae bacterium]
MSTERICIERKLGSLERCISRLESGQKSSEGKPDEVVALEIGQSLQLCIELASHVISSKLHDQRSGGPAGKFETLAVMGILPHGLATGMKESIELRNIYLNNCRSVGRGQIEPMIATHIRNVRKFAQALSSFQD